LKGEKEKMSKQETIEFESVTVKVPKAIMKYLRKIHGDPVEWIEYRIVDGVSADLDAMDGKILGELFDLGPVFKAVLGEAK